MITSYDNAEQPQSRRDLKKKKKLLEQPGWGWGSGKLTGETEGEVG